MAFDSWFWYVPVKARLIAREYLPRPFIFVQINNIMQGRCLCSVLIDITAMMFVLAIVASAAMVADAR
jgi:hypothetical protein